MTSPKIVVIAKLAYIQAEMTTMTEMTTIYKSSSRNENKIKVLAKTADTFNLFSFYSIQWQKAVILVIVVILTCI